MIYEIETSVEEEQALTEFLALDGRELSNTDFIGLSVAAQLKIFVDQMKARRVAGILEKLSAVDEKTLDSIKATLDVALEKK